MGKQSASIVILFGGDLFSFFNLSKDFPWKKAQIHHISRLKKVQGVRFLILVPQGRQEYRGILMYFYFHIRVYHQIWLIFLLASHHFVYTTKLNKGKKNKKTKKKNTGFRGWGQGGKKEVASYGMWLHSWGKWGSFHVFIGGPG